MALRLALAVLLAAGTLGEPLTPGTHGPLPPEVQARMRGVSWRPGCPVELEQLSYVVVPYVDAMGETRQGELVVHQDLAAEVVEIFAELYAAKFPIAKLELIDAYKGDDRASMAANNSSAFNCRVIEGTETLSQHAFGRAIDLNPLWNPWLRGDRIRPPAGAEYTDRANLRPGMITRGDVVHRAFRKRGWSWGGGWARSKDYQHFEKPLGKEDL